MESRASEHVDMIRLYTLMPQWEFKKCDQNLALSSRSYISVVYAVYNDISDEFFFKCSHPSHLIIISFLVFIIIESSIKFEWIIEQKYTTVSCFN